MTNTLQEKLWKAAASGDKATLRSMAFDDIDFDARDPEQRTAFNIATQNGHHDAAQTILALKEAQRMHRMGLTSPQYEAAQAKESKKTDVA